MGGTALGLVCSPALAANTPGEGFEVASYRLALTPDIRNRTVAGRETILLRATMEGVRRLRFSANALSIDTATLDGVAIPHSVEGDVLGFDLPRPLRRGHAMKLELSYHGRPARGFAGSETTLYTSYFACDWMVCSQNKFGEKAAFSLDLRVPAGMTSLSVGSMIQRRPRPDGSEVHRWKAPRPYSAYLYGFAVGPFTQVSERAGSNRLTYLSDIADAGELKRRLAGTRERVAFLSTRAGLPLPVADYGQLLVAGDEAQEAATYSVLGTDALPTKPDDPSEDWAVVHELAHQWWGNLITCETLKDFWLNEGITTFMTAAWKEHRYGRAAYDAELDVARRRLDKAQAAGFDKPLAWGGSYPTLGVRRAIHYSKGALFMAELRVTLGDAAFWSGLRRYTRDHAGGTVTSIDLKRAMEAASGRDLHPLFAQWVFGESRSARPG
ncbi:M1 family metallopeptidase [Sphingomonas aracearum]|uniref:M1 family metallopeptidase n=1 Tax=Sphingomonas aracearum TaxID=2283317 RepID=UPI001EF09B37|nr:M1 family metallopeptidase [Sphingomonas aracearum]